MCQQLRIVWPVLLLAGCSGSPSSLPSMPSTPAVPTAVTSVMVSGAAAALGEVSQFTDTATLSNGRTEDVTTQATWHSSDAGVVSASRGGEVHSVEAADAGVASVYLGKT